MNNRMNSGGWLPLPVVAVAVFPSESVTVKVTASGCAAPSVVLAGPPQVHVKENVELAPLCVRVWTSPSVHCVVQAKATSPFVPSGNEVDSRVQTVAELLVMRHSVVGLDVVAGSSIRNPATIPPPPPPALWAIVNVCPAMVIVPVRATSELAATL